MNKLDDAVSAGLHTPQSSSVQFLGREALEKMRVDVLDGAFEPGAKLPFAALQERYGVSVGTIREALSHLVSEGLITLDAGRGFPRGAGVAHRSSGFFRDASGF